jgi:hypothetical protein
VDIRRGKISDINFDGIYVAGDVLPPSIIRGFEPEVGEPEIITGVRVRNLYLYDKKITGQMNAHAIVELSRDVSFK